MTAKDEPSFAQLDVLRQLAKDPEHRLKRYPGGFWAPPSVPLGERGIPLWSTGASSVKAMDKRKWLARAGLLPESWRDERLLTARGLALLSEKEREGVVVVSNGEEEETEEKDPVAKRDSSSKRPTHVLKVKHEDGRRAKVGVAWQREDGSFYISLLPCVVLAWTDDVMISLFAHDEEDPK